MMPCTHFKSFYIAQVTYFLIVIQVYLVPTRTQPATYIFLLDAYFAKYIFVYLPTCICLCVLCPGQPSEINRAQCNQEVMGGSQASRQCSDQTITPTPITQGKYGRERTKGKKGVS